jgi:4-amino-4-deoxy-L-arabinose transferase-like glycosyltransferase
MELLKKNKYTILVGLVVILAAFLRLYRIGDYMTFLGDEGRDVLVVYNILHGHLTLLGPTASVGGFFLGPIYYYFMTPFLWAFHYNPVGPAVMVALFGIATVWLVYLVGNRFFGPKAGLIASLLYTISPLIIAYSRSSWNPNPMPFFVLALLYFLYKGLQEKNWKYILFSGIFLGIAMQLHYLATFVGVIVAVYILVASMYDIFPKKVPIIKVVYQSAISYMLYAIGFIIGWLPFLTFEFRHGFQNIKSIINFILHSKQTGAGEQMQTIIGNVSFRIFGRLVTNFPPPENVNLHTHLDLATWYYGTIVLAILSVGFVAYNFLKNLKDRKKFLQYSLLLLWLGIGIYLFGFYKKQIYDYYFSFLFPLPFLLVGSFLAWTMSKTLLVKICGIAILLSLFVINIQGIPFRYEPNRQLDQVRKIAQVVYDQAHKKPFNFALITGGNSDHAYRYFLTTWGNPPVTIENAAVDPKRTTVTNQLLVVCEELPCHPEGASLWEVAGFGRAQIVGHWDVSVVQVYKLEHYTGK